MKTPKQKNLNISDIVQLQTKSKIWKGLVLESHDPEVILLKLDSGYNIGIRESEILNVKVIQSAEKTISKKEAEKTAPQTTLNKKLPNIAMIITGGTISSRLDPKTGGVISTDAEEILTIAPELKNICNITKIEKPFMKWSENMSFQDWKKLAQTCEKLLNNNDISGIIITHGTDFLHYTASALSFFIQNLNKPIALTYSQRSIDRGSTDAALNLICSAKYATSDIAEVTIIGHKNLDDEICLAMPGTKTRKMHTSRRDTFKIINSEPLAEITKTKLTILKQFNARNSNKVKLDAKFSDKVALIKIHPAQSPAILDFYANQNYKGIILELSGLGHTPSKQSKQNWLPTIKKLTKKGITICGAPQTLYGRLNPNVYSAGRELQKTGIIFLQDMLPETALIKLSWVLGHPSWAKDKNKIKEKMLTNFANEISDEIGFEF
ncbi:Glu-tRNA(Gln) amidotransferase GatDE subunit D [Candidatus Pacearchaeota archaeon]|nr:Glu-tRNA(Gln) amidotransferase GatDE subunit D [Candidatus Pacearchaeota archaeon]|tara:strand:+ start:2263 stop:3573 length:1311 start_codon:yes stop_codon:yes gene_type:complete